MLKESSRDVIECGKAVECILDTDNIEQGRVSIVARHDDEISMYVISLDVTDRGRDAILGNERLETDGYIISRTVESSQSEMVGRERYGSEANAAMNRRVLYESDSLDDGMTCECDHENVKQGRVSVVARHSHVDRSVSCMLRSHGDGEANRVNCSSRVELCAAGIECSIDGIVSSIL